MFYSASTFCATPAFASTSASASTSIVPLASSIEQLSSKLVFIDPRVEGLGMLLTGLRADLDAIVLDLDLPGLLQLDEVLTQYGGVREIHLIARGKPGRIQLGSGWIDASTLQQQSILLNRWREFLAEEAEIWVYGCQVASGEAGRCLLHQLHCLTGANVAAPQTLMGCAERSGNRELELGWETCRRVRHLPYRCKSAIGAS